MLGASRYPSFMEATMAFGRVGLILTLALGILGAPLAANAQQVGKVPRIGSLVSGSPATSGHLVEGFRHGLREHGWIEGQNIAIEYRWAEGKFDRLPELAAELVRLKVDIIFAPGPSAPAARDATKTIPVVFTGASDPVGEGYILSLARPGRNMTGLTLSGPELSGKRLELLKETVPEVSRVAVLWNRDDHPVHLPVTEAAARVLGVQLQILDLRDPSEFESAFAAMTRERAGALILLPSARFFFHRQRLAELALKHRLPPIVWRPDLMDAGFLMAYGSSLRGEYQRAAAFVNKILNGAKPGDLPVEEPMKFELVINLKTAKTLGLTIPPSVLIRADKLIE
jgi:putative ABC transport system substrate-binding protein